MAPEQFGDYFEPMIGGGALFLSLQPERGVIADANEDLINFYVCLRDDTQALCAALAQLEASKEEYYRRRAERPGSPLEQAMRFYYLNRLCWNGLYRVNLKGQFNVPFGGRVPRTMCDVENLSEASRILQNVRILHGDFEETTSAAHEGDFVYFDPPYPKGAADNDGFCHYNRTRFTYKDHQRLAKAASTLADCGVHVMITESAHPRILDLYGSRFFKSVVKSRSLIAGRSDRRGEVDEAIITSYDALVPCSQ